MAVFVYPIPTQHRGKMLEHPRLYAFPTQPEPHGEAWTILDSGAFGLSKRGMVIGAKHMEKLSAHYAAHGASDNRPVVGIAPDVFPDPFRTLDNWRLWHKWEYGPVAPVIQFTKIGEVDVSVAVEQVRIYRDRKPAFWCVSNPGLRGEVAKARGIEKVFAAVKKAGATWVHCLGAGWDADDREAWGRMHCLDSFDSIAWYLV